MAFDWNEVREDLDLDVFQELGYKVKLIKADDRTATAWAVDANDEKKDTPQGPSRTTLENKQVLISASIKHIPEVGDILVKNKIELVISDVEIVQPSTVVVAYKVTVR